VVNTSRSFPCSWLITGFVSRLTRWVSLVEQELPTLLNHLSSHPVFSGASVTRSLVFIRMFCRSLFALFCSFFLWLLCCRFFFDIQILITPLISSNSSINRMHSSWIHVKLSLEVFPLKLETLLICIRERETQGLVLQSISKVNNFYVWWVNILMFGYKQKISKPYESKLTSVSRKEST
jgi:hypothetical protein